jgi:2-oxo-4-hydroxy-4-carboxy--5-ureidoimidazoline (OHCU) decarboxylase
LDEDYPPLLIQRQALHKESQQENALVGLDKLFEKISSLAGIHVQQFFDMTQVALFNRSRFVNQWRYANWHVLRLSDLHAAVHNAMQRPGAEYSAQ